MGCTWIGFGCAGLLACQPASLRTCPWLELRSVGPKLMPRVWDSGGKSLGARISQGLGPQPKGAACGGIWEPRKWPDGHSLQPESGASGPGAHQDPRTQGLSRGAFYSNFRILVAAGGGGCRGTARFLETCFFLRSFVCFQVAD